MNIGKLSLILEKEPNFRLKQVKQAVFVDLIESWDENSTLPLALKQKLKKEYPLTQEVEIESSGAGDSQKILMKFSDGLSVEAVLLKHKDGRKTVCVSSQVGCSMGCLFCATGKIKCKRNLTADEIVAQVLFFARLLKKSEDEHKRITNIVFMGMGEPFLNYDNVMEAVHILNDKDCLGVGSRHISISTCGIIEGIEKFAKEGLQLNLAISLHASNDELRSKLMPINKKDSLENLMSTVREYAEKSSRQVMFEYMMIDGINDTKENAQELAKLLNHRLYVLNLIRYNPTGEFRPSKPQAIKVFKDFLLQKGIKVTQRYAFGQDIVAACGQLAGKN